MMRLESTETVSEELTNLQKEFEAEIPKMLQEMAFVTTGELYDDDAPIPSLMSQDFNPFLFMSGQYKNNRIVETGLEHSQITITYSGMGLHKTLGRNAKVWREFAKGYEQDPQDRVLGRDYAYFQETGHDPVADSRDAKHKHAIKFGLLSSAFEIRKELANQLKKLIG